MNKVISASAGSGKTYRLAIEYLIILLKNLHQPDFHFERILMITFTRAAAGEIRQKIFFLLEQLLIQKDLDLIAQLENETKFTLTNHILHKLGKVWNQIKINQNLLRICTIDALLNQVFKAMIAPIMKIGEYTIDENANEDIYDLLFNELTDDQHFQILQEFTEIDIIKDKSTYSGIFKKLIDNRWLLDYWQTKNTQKEKQPSSCQKSPYLSTFQTLFTQYAKSLKQEIDLRLATKSSQTFDSFFVNHTFDLLKIERDQLNNENFLPLIKLCGEKYIHHLSSSLINSLIAKDYLKLYNGAKLRLKDPFNYSEMKQAFVNFVNEEYAQKERNLISSLWTVILEKYDLLKQKSKIFTYSDIEWYTYKYLLTQDNSLFNHTHCVVENQFYEFLAVRNQYLLIDEFQDTSLIQFKILAPMINDLVSGNSIYQDTSVIVVGDEKQSIYGWRGGEKGLLNYMHYFLNTKAETLKINYRSVPALVNFINQLFQETESLPGWEFSADVQSARKDELGGVKNYFHDTVKNNQNVATCFVRDFVDPEMKKQNLGDVAILARTNDELENIGSALANFGIPFINESKNSLFLHPLIQSIMYLLKYLQNQDRVSLLKFFRSDLVLMNSKDFKYLATSLTLPSCPESLLSLVLVNDHLSIQTKNIVQKILHFTSLPKNPLLICQAIIAQLNIFHLMPTDYEQKNLHLFLSVITDFLHHPKNYLADLEGFMLYAEKMHQKKAVKQISLQTSNSVKLMTIHKSKGLGFDTVFLYLDTKNRLSQNSEINIGYTVTETNYNQLEHVFVYRKYKSIYQELYKREMSRMEQKQVLEEMNNLYVATTRAKKNLGIYWVYAQGTEANSKTHNTLYLLHKTKDLVDQKLIMAEEFYPIYHQQIKDEYFESAKYYQKSMDHQEHHFHDHHYFCLGHQEEHFLPVNLNSPYIELIKSTYLSEKKNIYGELTHYYLSMIKYNRLQEHQQARAWVIKKFGNLLSLANIESTIEKIKDFINQNHQYFLPLYDQIYTEFIIFDQQSKQYRVDRIMVNKNKKEILLVDFKTGSIHQENQLIHYKKIIEKLPICQREKYQVTTVYLSICI